MKYGADFIRRAVTAFGGDENLRRLMLDKRGADVEVYMSCRLAGDQRRAAIHAEWMQLWRKEQATNA